MSNDPQPPNDSRPVGLATAHKSHHGALRTLRSADLLQGQVEVLIEHGSDLYRLRLTRSGKLILQK